MDRQQIERIIKDGPAHVLVNADGLQLRPLSITDLRSKHPHIKIDVILLSSDGPSLGTPYQFRHIAFYSSEKWDGFIDVAGCQWFPISEWAAYTSEK